MPVLHQGVVVMSKLEGNAARKLNQDLFGSPIANPWLVFCAKHTDKGERSSLYSVILESPLGMLRVLSVF